MDRIIQSNVLFSSYCFFSISDTSTLYILGIFAHCIKALFCICFSAEGLSLLELSVFCCQKLMFIPLFLQDKWIGLLHHVANEHEWVLEEGENGAKCDHDPLQTDEDRDKPWLKKGSSAHKALAKIILDKRFLNTFKYYTHFRYILRLIFIYISIYIYTCPGYPTCVW